MSSACLTWGDLDLDPTSEGSTYEITAMATEGEGLNLGNPEPVEVALRSLLQDGSIVFSQGHDNREVLVAITVRGATGDALAQAESALMGQIGRAGVNLTWRSVTPFTTPGVFEVVTSSLDYDFIPDREHALSRLYVIRLVCLPWVRSVARFVSAATPVRDEGGVPITPAVTSISAATSTTGWSSTVGAVTLVESGSAVSRDGGVGTNLTRTGSINLTVQRYLFIDYKAVAASGTPIVTLRVAGEDVPAVAVAPSPEYPGYTRAYYDIGATISAFTLNAQFNTQVPGGNLRVTQVSTTNVITGAGTTRQTYRRLPVPGSVRTQGSIRVEHETQALGDVLLYTWADDGSAYLPPLAPYTGSRLAASGTVSGASSNLDAPVVYTIPAAALPAGDYLLLARLNSATAGVFPLVLDVSTRIAGTVLDRVPTSRTLDVDFKNGGSLWQVTPLTALTLPTVRLDGGGAASIRLSLAAADPATVNLDEAWLFNTTIGSLTQVSCGGAGVPGPGGQSRRLWVQPETVASRATILRGHAADGSDAFYAAAGTGGAIDSVGSHELLPGSMSVFAVTTEALDAETTISGFARWHTHPVS